MAESNRSRNGDPVGEIVCPLCGATQGCVLEHVPVRALDREYRRQMGVSVMEEFGNGVTELLLMRCGTCGLEWFHPTVAGSARFYERLGVNEQYYSTTRWEFTETLRRLPPDPDLIDVGCGDGFFLRSVTGTRRRGIEYNPDAARRAREAGLPVEETRVELLPAGSADAVTLFQVLEHVPRPREVLSALERVLRPGGRLFVAVPNNDGWVGRAPANPLNAPPHHPLRWRSEALRHVPKLTGLVLEDLAEEPLAPEHRLHYRRALALERMAGLLRWEIPRYGVSPAAVAARKVATLWATLTLRLGAGGLPGSAPGHSLLAVYRKP